MPNLTLGYGIKFLHECKYHHLSLARDEENIKNSHAQQIPSRAETSTLNRVHSEKNECTKRHFRHKHIDSKYPGVAGVGTLPQRRSHMFPGKCIGLLPSEFSEFPLGAGSRS